METYFNVAYCGQHVFRTDTYDSRDADVVEKHLVELFGVSLAYSITRHDRNKAWTIKELMPT